VGKTKCRAIRLCRRHPSEFRRCATGFAVSGLPIASEESGCTKRNSVPLSAHAWAMKLGDEKEMKMDAEDLLKGLAVLSSIKSEGSARDRTDKSVEDLARSYLKSNDFKVGDRIVLKEGMGGMHTFPTPGQVCVVIDVLEEPVGPTFEKAFGSPHFMMPHDIRIALKDPDGDFVCFLIDSRLFEPVKPGNVTPFKRRGA
jgi:hypothetical protein